MIALVIGFGFWWIYFDLVGRRPPRPDGRALATWLLSHLPITMSITAAGAAMVSLIAHAHDARTPANTAWLLAGAVAVGLLALILTMRSLADAERLAVVYRPMTWRWSSAPAPPWSPAGFDRPRGCLRSARRDPVGPLVLRRQPLPPRRRLGGRAVAPPADTRGASRHATGQRESGTPRSRPITPQSRTSSTHCGCTSIDHVVVATEFDVEAAWALRKVPVGGHRNAHWWPRLALVDVVALGPRLAVFLPGRLAVRSPVVMVRERWRRFGTCVFMGVMVVAIAWKRRLQPVVVGCSAWCVRAAASGSTPDV